MHIHGVRPHPPAPPFGGPGRLRRYHHAPSRPPARRKREHDLELPIRTEPTHPAHDPRGRVRRRTNDDRANEHPGRRKTSWRRRFGTRARRAHQHNGDKSYKRDRPKTAVEHNLTIIAPERVARSVRLWNQRVLVGSQLRLAQPPWPQLRDRQVRHGDLLHGRRSNLLTPRGRSWNWLRRRRPRSAVVRDEGDVDLVAVVVSLVPAGFTRRIDEPASIRPKLRERSSVRLHHPKGQ